MDITQFIVSKRDAALLYGDYSTYQAQLGKKLLKARKRLGIATKNRGKYQKKDQFSAEDVGQNHEYAHLILLTSERAWANAMSMRAAHTADTKGINSRTRKHIVSRLDKAARLAESLAVLLAQPESGATRNDRLESQAYAALIRGAALFEKQSWEPCVESYAVARIVYSALATATASDMFKDLLSETIDPSIRYAAYQLKTPRTVPVATIARKAFPQSDEWIVQQVNELDARALGQGDAQSRQDAAEESVPRTLTWRSREVKIEDAAIALAWGRVQQAKGRLVEQLSSLADAKLKKVASAYDSILTATQDAVDATKNAIEELRGEGVSQSDSRMQSLQVTRTAVNYEMISWRIGRNRVLTGDRDGAVENYEKLSGKKTKKEPSAAKRSREERPRYKAGKLRELVALYEGILQSVESVKELPGVAADEPLTQWLHAITSYFQALKVLAIARSHDIIGNTTNALALINHAHDLAQTAAPVLSQAPQPPAGSPRNIQPTAEDADFLKTFLSGQVLRFRALVHMENLQKKAEEEYAAQGPRAPLIERLHEYPIGPVDLTNLVEMPPKVAPIPVKPIFLDIAWNYIQYPEFDEPAKPAAEAKKEAEAESAESAEAEKSRKKGWFGFGR
ncbi:signal recognition particle 68 kDa protein [Sodiomyces alkalinus F11]|uniref:Signal recognition particle subunit SRP68 n=1 Tax=Sodiomyces alkalinus (strain CBS 110278 / VKM F-3762 / F11) TaxID=1314773 RepID=A0A3N2PVX1_SODAK|nr:signal recognition particle 68 kDa protein [Sodiomyces alkalinus F11]ROT38660.1 signal recognition particle 68 kDa protein [Sodiomyces alkalinus F11]